MSQQSRKPELYGMNNYDLLDCTEVLYRWHRNTDSISLDCFGHQLDIAYKHIVSRALSLS